ncbi:MAG: ABC transporter ATP-binding protein [Alphaproteobacteria bacterium]|nr:MAG: ABC transporter ATP-binding protein [Alphaproteobacteria bacterium]
MTLLALSGVTVRRAGRAVVQDAALTVAPGEVVGLIGPNAAGKSTLLRAALGLIAAEGSIRLGREEIARLSPPARARRAAFLPQGREIAWPVSVRALVGLAARDGAAVDRALAATGTSALADRPATSLSGGEQALVLLARALAQEAPLLVADEPLAGLDPAHQLAALGIFRARAAAGQGVLLALHELGLAARHCDRVALIHRGRILAAGAPAEVITAARLAEVYGIEAEIIPHPAGMIVLPRRRARP